MALAAFLTTARTNFYTKRSIDRVIPPFIIVTAKFKGGIKNGKSGKTARIVRSQR